MYEVDRIVDEKGLIWAIEGISHIGREWTELSCAADVSALGV